MSGASPTPTPTPAPAKVCEKLVRLIESVVAQTEKVLAPLPQGPTRQKEEKAVQVFRQLTVQLSPPNEPSLALVASGYQNLAIFLFNKRKFRESSALSGNAVQLYDTVQDFGKAFAARLLQAKSLLGLSKTQETDRDNFDKLLESIAFLEESLGKLDTIANVDQQQRLGSKASMASAPCPVPECEALSLRSLITLYPHRISMQAELARAKTRHALYLRQLYYGGSNHSSMSNSSESVRVQSPAVFASALWNATSCWAQLVMDPVFQAVIRTETFAKVKDWARQSLSSASDQLQAIDALRSAVESAHTQAKQTLRFHVDVFDYLDLYPQLIATLKLLNALLPASGEPMMSSSEHIERELIYLQIQTAYFRLGRLPASEKYLALALSSMTQAFPDIGGQELERILTPQASKSSSRRGEKKTASRKNGSTDNGVSLPLLVDYAECVMKSIEQSPNGACSVSSESASPVEALPMSPSSSTALDWGNFARHRWLLSLASHVTACTAGSAVATSEISQIEAKADSECSPITLCFRRMQAILVRLNSSMAALPPQLKRTAAAIALTGDIALARSESAMFGPGATSSSPSSPIAASIRLAKQSLSAWMALLRKVSDSSHSEHHKAESPESKESQGASSGMAFLASLHSTPNADAQTSHQSVGDAWQHAAADAGYSEGLASLWHAARGTGRSLTHLATLLESAGQPRSAAYFLNQCTELSTQTRFPALAASCALAMSRLERARGRVDRATEHLRKAWASLSSSPDEITASQEASGTATKGPQESSDNENDHNELWTDDWRADGSNACALWPSVKAEALAIDARMKLSEIAADHGSASNQADGADELKELADQLSAINLSSPEGASSKYRHDQPETQQIIANVQHLVEAVGKLLHQWVIVRDIEKEIAEVINQGKELDCQAGGSEKQAEILPTSLSESLPVHAVLSASLQNQVDAICLRNYHAAKPSELGTFPSWLQSWVPLATKPASRRGKQDSFAFDEANDDQGMEAEARAALLALTDDILVEDEEKENHSVDRVDELMMKAPSVLLASLAVAPTPALRCESYLVRSRWTLIEALSQLNLASRMEDGLSAEAAAVRVSHASLALLLLSRARASAFHAWNSLAATGTVAPTRLASKAALLAVEASIFWRQASAAKSRNEHAAQVAEALQSVSAGASTRTTRGKAGAGAGSKRRAQSSKSTNLDVITPPESIDEEYTNWKTAGEVMLHHLSVGLTYRHEKVIVCENLISAAKQTIAQAQAQNVSNFNAEPYSRQISTAQLQIETLSFAPSVSDEIKRLVSPELAPQNLSLIPLASTIVGITLSSSKSHLIVSRLIREPLQSGESGIRAALLAFSLDEFPAHAMRNRIVTIMREIAESHAAAITVSQQQSDSPSAPPGDDGKRAGGSRAKSAGQLSESTARWWANRFQLDTRLLSYLIELEMYIFGPFAGVLRSGLVSDEQCSLSQSISARIRAEALQLAELVDQLTHCLHLEKKDTQETAFLLESVLVGALTSPLLMKTISQVLPLYTSGDETKQALNEADLNCDLPSQFENLLEKSEFVRKHKPVECVAAYVLGITDTPVCTTARLARYLFPEAPEEWQKNLSQPALSQALLQKAKSQDTEDAAHASLAAQYAGAICTLTQKFVRAVIGLASERRAERSIACLPLVLALGRGLQDIPWESLPVCRQVEIVHPPASITAAAGLGSKAATTKSSSSHESAGHTLVPCLLAQSVAPQRATRVPSLWFIFTLAQQQEQLRAIHPHCKVCLLGAETSKHLCGQAQLQAIQNPDSVAPSYGLPAVLTGYERGRVYYILNPSNDLLQTQAALEPLFTQELASQGWRGIVATPPTPIEFAKELGRNDLLIYAGHNGGEQYVSYEEVSRMRGGACVWLMGCSSGSLQCVSPNSEYDPTGIAMAHLLAGAPSVVANLWEVSDRDADKITLAMVESITHRPLSVTVHGKIPASYRVVENYRGDIDVAVSAFRSACRLPYVNGAPLVNYGLPVRLAFAKVAGTTESSPPESTSTEDKSTAETTEALGITSTTTRRTRTTTNKASESARTTRSRQ